MAFTINELGSKRKLETTITFKIENDDGSEKIEPFRIIIRDYPAAEHNRIVEECRTEADNLQKEYEAKRAEYETAHTEYEAKLAEYNAAPEDNKPELPQNGFQPPDLPPNEQILYHSKVVADLPDLRGDDGQSVPFPTVETFMRLGHHTNLSINSAIWKRRFEVDEKK